MTISLTEVGKTVQSVLDQKWSERIMKVAKREPPFPNGFPHITNRGEYDYVYYPLDWWTSGFFPGSVWALYERSLKSNFPFDVNLARKWSRKLEPHRKNCSTHDLGFLIMPSYQREYDLTGNEEAGRVIVDAAESLATRWCEAAQAFKSWDSTKTENYHFNNPEHDTLVIIDNMMNLDLLYSASIISGDEKYAKLATIHADTTAKYHVRDDFSTYHLVVFDTVTGIRKVCLTHQGYDHESTWSRGQAWALYGFATVYKYTGETKYLELAKKLANYFMSRTENGGVYWDFDAPRPCAWDTSAAMVACSGMLMICQLENSREYLSPALELLNQVLEDAMAPSGDVILDRACVTNYRYNKSSLTDHGLVYADYYFLEVGNRLIDLGLANRA
uniref:ARAD1A13332p n=1 Tax=Blastobotrys adeninivorans TaxID=409370 RepID=A0A060SYM6_BLAAD